jgi:hypothetical protein
MFILIPLKSIKIACLTRQIAEKVLLIVNVILSLSCSHPFCEEIKIEEIIPREPQTIIFKPGAEGKDAIVSSFYPDSNFSDSKSLNIVTWIISRNRIIEESYIDFDLAKVIPPNAKVTSATLKLFADIKNKHYEKYGHVNFTESFWKISLVTSPWDEKKISWFNRPLTDSNEVMIQNSPGKYYQNYSINVISYVQKKLKDPQRYHGLCIAYNSYNFYISERMIRFCSSDHQDEQLRPELELVVNYND